MLVPPDPKDPKSREIRIPPEAWHLVHVWAWILGAPLIGFACTVLIWSIFGGWSAPDEFICTGIGIIAGLVRANALMSK